MTMIKISAMGDWDWHCDDWISGSGNDALRAARLIG